MSRAGRRGEPDRFEIERAEFFTRVRETYLQLVEQEPDRFVLIDATRDIDSVKADVGRVAEALLRQ